MMQEIKSELKSDFSALFKDDKLSVGGQVKAKGEVLKEFFKSHSKPPNLNCRVESFGRICQTFDFRRRRWVSEMGFGGLLYLSGDMHLPRQLGYWLMTRIDPFNKMVITREGSCLRLSRNQVHWVLGIPNGSKVVPTYKTLNNVQRQKVKKLISKFGHTRKSQPMKADLRVYELVGIPVYPELMKRLECHWEDHEEEDFKTLFLLLALEMFLCPTLSPRLASDLVPALSCAMDASEYDWCTLVLSKLLGSVRSFGRRFYSKGHAGGCGGCTLFALIFYLDRLDREAVDWGVFPRLKVWNMKRIAEASKEDRSLIGGDYGKLGTLDVAYGEIHPRQARDTDGPTKVELDDHMDCLPARRRRGTSSSSNFRRRKNDNNPSGAAHNDVTVDVVQNMKPVVSQVKIPYGKGDLHCRIELDVLTRWISNSAFSLFRRMISLIMSSGTCPLMPSFDSGEVLMFRGGCKCRQMLMPYMESFVKNPRCQFLVVVSEVFVPECEGFVSAGDPALIRVCIVSKTTIQSQLSFVHADSVSSFVTFDKRCNPPQLYDAIFQRCMMCLSDCKLSRNVLILHTSRE